MMMQCDSGERGEPCNQSKFGVLGPHAVSGQIYKAIALCWMTLPPHKRTVDEVTQQVRRVVDRALADLSQDAQAFGLSENGDTE